MLTSKIRKKYKDVFLLLHTGFRETDLFTLCMYMQKRQTAVEKINVKTLVSWQSCLSFSQSQSQWHPLDTSVVGDVTVRLSKMHGEFISLKLRPMTSGAVCYRIELAVAWVSQPNTSAWHSNNFTQDFLIKNRVIHQKVHGHTFT